MKATVSLASPVMTAAVLSLALSACSGTSQADLASASQSAAQSQAQKDAAAQQAKTQASLKAEVDALKAKASRSSSASQSSSSSSAPTSSDTGTATVHQSASRITSCGSNLSVGPNTTCAFASNVESDYYGSGGGYQNLDVYSPVTGRYYSMTCNPGVPTVCRGGNNAVVYIR